MATTKTKTEGEAAVVVCVDGHAGPFGVFAQGARVRSDHPAVSHAPALWAPDGSTESEINEQRSAMYNVSLEQVEQRGLEQRRQDRLQERAGNRRVHGRLRARRRPARMGHARSCEGAGVREGRPDRACVRRQLRPARGLTRVDVRAAKQMIDAAIREASKPQVIGSGRRLGLDRKTEPKA